jgi:hypothetical protein
MQAHSALIAVVAMAVRGLRACWRNGSLLSAEHSVRDRISRNGVGGEGLVRWRMVTGNAYDCLTDGKTLAPAFMGCNPAVKVTVVE